MNYQNILLSLQPWLNRPILVVKIIHVGHKIFDDIHMRQWIDLHGLVEISSIDFANTCQSVCATDGHGARSANSLATRSTESQSRIHFILDFNQSIEHHWTASVQIDLVRLNVRLLLWDLRIPSVDFERLESLSSIDD